jgi:hypothetical protein
MPEGQETGRHTAGGEGHGIRVNIVCILSSCTEGEDGCCRNS